MIDTYIQQIIVDGLVEYFVLEMIIPNVVVNVTEFLTQTRFNLGEYLAETGVPLDTWNSIIEINV
jgi:hypothetical protein